MSPSPIFLTIIGVPERTPLSPRGPTRSQGSSAEQLHALSTMACGRPSFKFRGSFSSLYFDPHGHLGFPRLFICLICLISLPATRGFDHRVPCEVVTTSCDRSRSMRECRSCGQEREDEDCFESSETLRFWRCFFESWCFVVLLALQNLNNPS